MKIEIVFTDEKIVPPPPEFLSREIGASVEFSGIVREMERGTTLEGLYYEAYETMAAEQMRRIFEELALIHPAASIFFVHRLGWVPVGEISVFIRVLSAHRGEALALCGAAIDQMKADVPIWKMRSKPASTRPVSTMTTH